MPHKSSYARVSHYDERKINLPTGMIVAQGSHTLAWLTAVNNEWEQDETVNADPLCSSMKDKA